MKISLICVGSRVTGTANETVVVDYIQLEIDKNKGIIIFPIKEFLGFYSQDPRLGNLAPRTLLISMRDVRNLHW